jgi:hypothetical protein
MYINAKMIPVETISVMLGGGHKGESQGGVNSWVVYLIHCKNFCKCHNIHLLNTIIKEKR